MKLTELLTDETKWCRGTYAKDANGYGISPLDPAAVRWCVSGAMFKLGWPSTDKLVELIQSSSITFWNDNLVKDFAELRSLLLEAGL